MHMKTVTNQFDVTIRVTRRSDYAGASMQKRRHRIEKMCDAGSAAPKRFRGGVIIGRGMRNRYNRRRRRVTYKVHGARQFRRNINDPDIAA
jgi:hypothetical protein